MEFWNRARSFAEEAAKKSQEITKEAAKRSQEITKEAAKRSQELTIGASKISDIVSETAKRSKEIAVEASKKADQIKVEALKRADQIKSLVDSSLPPVTPTATEASDLEQFGVTDELREFVKEITIDTFRDFPIEDDLEMSNVPTVSNVRQDLTEWQERHANFVLSTVKEISKLRYELCPRYMKERKFWRIYFILVNSHVATYEKKYMEGAKKSVEQLKQENEKEAPAIGTSDSKMEAKEIKRQSVTSTSSITEQDLDVFLLGDLGDSDGGTDNRDEGFDDDFDKMVDSSDDEKVDI